MFNKDKFSQFNSQEIDSFGVSAFNQNNFELSIELFSYAIEKDPKNSNAYYNRANAYYEIGETTKVIEDFTNAIKINPNFESAYFNRAHERKTIGDYKGSFEDYSKVIKLNPKKIDAYYCRGRLNWRPFGDIEGAYNDFTTGLKFDPKNEDLLEELKALKSCFPFL